MDIGINDKIEQLAQGIANSMNLELVEVKYSPRKSRGVVQVYIHKENGVDIDDCSKLSRELEVLLDAENLIKDPYNLEVSSPGLDRPLKTNSDFKRNLGKKIVVSYKTDLSPNVSVTGTLRDIKKGQIVLVTKKDEELINVKDIMLAKLEICI